MLQVHSLLESEEDLLAFVVEATRNVPKDEREPFFVLQTYGTTREHTSLMHKGWDL